MQQGIIQLLRVFEHMNLALAGGEKIAHSGFADIVVRHGVVIGAVALQQCFIGCLKGIALVVALIINQHHLAAGLENTVEFVLCAGAVKPMIGLPGKHKIHAGIGQGGGFGAAVHAAKAGVLPQLRFGGAAHGLVGLHCIHAVAVLQQ